jgi:hypothetical protein
MSCSFHTFIEEGITSLFYNVVLGSVKYSYQLDHQIHTKCIMTRAIALSCYTELAFLTPTLMCF